MQYLSNNLEDAKYRLIYSFLPIEEIAYQRGQVIAYDDVLGLCDQLDGLEEAQEQNKQRVQKISDPGLYQAIEEGKTKFN